MRFSGIKRILDNMRFFCCQVYDEVTEDIFDMSNVRCFKEIEKKNGGCLYYVFGQLSSVKRLA